MQAASYEPMVVVNNGKPVASLIATRDEKHITEIKRHISLGFSQSTWLKQEDQIDSVLALLIEKLHTKVGTEIDLKRFLSFWSFDTLTTLAFSESRGYLNSERDIDGVFASGSARFKHWGLWMSMPTLEQLIYKNRFAQRAQKGGSKLVELALKRIHERKTGGGMATGRDLLGRYLAASQQAPNVIAPNDVLGLTISTIHAGSETTATNASLVLVRTLQDPRVLAKLEEEILQANLSHPPTFAEVDKLQYLDACLHEAIRLSINPNCTERTVSPNDAEICGIVIPAGTDVSICEAMISCDRDVFGADADTFRPERWLDVGKARFAEMDRSAFGFAYGRRACLGQHLARIEVKKVVAAVLENFKVCPIAKLPACLSELAHTDNEQVHPTEAPWYKTQDNQLTVNLKVRLESRL